MKSFRIFKTTVEGAQRVTKKDAEAYFDNNYQNIVRQYTVHQQKEAANFKAYKKFTRGKLVKTAFSFVPSVLRDAKNEVVKRVCPLIKTATNYAFTLAVTPVFVLGAAVWDSCGTARRAAKEVKMNAAKPSKRPEAAASFNL